MTTATNTPALAPMARALAEGSRVLHDLAERMAVQPTPVGVDEYLAQTRGLLMLALRLRQQFGGDSPPPPARGSTPPPRRAA
jgi:hypothetical protein